MWLHVYFSGDKQTNDKEEKEKPVSLLALVSIATCVLTMHYCYTLSVKIFDIIRACFNDLCYSVICMEFFDDSNTDGDSWNGTSTLC